MNNVKTYFSREKIIFLSGGSVLFGLGLLFNSYLYFGSLEFFDSFPSHESIGLISIIFGFVVMFSKMFSFKLPKWLRDKNNKKIIGRIINKIIK